MPLQLYTHPMSPCSQKVRIVLAEKALTWDKVDIDLPSKENLSTEYLKLNPAGVVPTLVEDGKPVVESSVICEYLEDRYPDPRLRPIDPHQTSSMRNWMRHVDNKLHPSCGALQWPLVMADKLKRLPAEEQDRIMATVPERPRRERQIRLLKMGYGAPDVVDAVRVYEKTISDLDVLLGEQKWIAGDDFSLADAAMAPYFQTPYQFGWREWYESRPNVADWYARCRDRDSYEAGVGADFSASKLEELQERGKTAWQKIQALLKTARSKTA
ncbi:MAG TPA: glutathione S-transferase [Gammaproteobacteria bacterium]|nr:glutathione S-transferase [Gammaproteobacteria bacterium]